MRVLILIMSALALAPGLAAAPAAKEPSGQGYAYVAPGGVSGSRTATLHFGVGGEGLVYQGLGVGADIGYLGAARSLRQGFGVFSFNGSYHFQNASSSRKLVPFVTGGYSLLFRSGAANGFNFGAGINYCIGKRMGLRLEFRDQVFTLDGTAHFYGFRIGIAFR